MPKDFLIIANPAAGLRSAPAAASAVCQRLRAGGKTVDLFVTAARGEARTQARQAAQAGVPTVIGCGGDGTLQEIATSLEHSPTRLGIIPSGRCNDFAQSLGISTKRPPDMLARDFLTGHTRTTDLGAAGEHRFLTVATLGFDSQVSRFVETHRLWIKGTAAYLYGVLRVLWNFQFPQVRLRGSFGIYEGRILLAATGNTACYGGAMKIAPGAQLDDGLFQVCIVQNLPRLSVHTMLPKVMRGAHLTHPAVKIAATRFLEIETLEAPEWICADGESLLRTPCRLDMHAAALQVITPA